MPWTYLSSSFVCAWEQAAQHGLIDGSSGWSECDSAVGNLFALFFEHSIGKREEFCPGHGSQNLFEIVSADLVSRIKLGVQFAGRLGKDGPHAAQHSIESCSLRFRSSSESLGNALGRSTEIAHTTSPSAVRRITKVPHEGRHAALIALRKANHLIDLRPFLITLLNVGRAPLFIALAYVLRKIQHCAFVNPKFLESFVEEICLYRQAFAEGLLRLGFCISTGLFSSALPFASRFRPSPQRPRPSNLSVARRFQWFDSGRRIFHA
jgi:hypothetical protein